MRIGVPTVRFVLLVLAASSALTAQLSLEQPARAHAAAQGTASGEAPLAATAEDGFEPAARLAMTS